MTENVTERSSWQRCSECGAELDARDMRSRCPECRGLLEVLHRPPSESANELRVRFDLRAARGESGVWRFAELVHPEAAGDAVSHPEGNTPLLYRTAVADWTGSRDLRLKHEGHNPTGSFKDRGMTVGVTQAERIGATAVACASTGNTSASLAAYAAQAGIPALVLVPAGQVALGKLAQSLAYGARTLLVRGDFDQCLRLVEEASERLGVYLLNSVNPWRVEGQKTVALELVQQLGWNPPDWVVLPAGNLGNTAAIGKAFLEARAIGLIQQVPRIAAVQAEGASPFARSFRDGFRARHRMQAETVATAIRIGDPASYGRAAAVIRETDGVVLSVTDDEIMEAKAVVDGCGVGCEPASAASVAGVRRLVADGVMRPDERVVAILTGHVLKDPGALLAYHRDADPAPPRANRPIEIDATLQALERVLAT